MKRSLIICSLLLVTVIVYRYTSMKMTAVFTAGFLTATAIFVSLGRKQLDDGVKRTDKTISDYKNFYYDRD